MSVLVEALTLVVPKRVLDMSYPGGTDAYLEALLHSERPPRFICNGDVHLVNASFYDPEHILRATELLTAHGIVSVDDGKFVEMACVDQAFGPTMPCEWLEWRRHRDGFTWAWYAGTEPGDMAAPDGWSAEQSRELVREDMRDEPGRCLRLSAEGDVETWLDFATGHVLAGLPQRAEHGREATGAGMMCTTAEGTESAASPLMPVVQQVLDVRSWKGIPLSDDSIIVRVRDRHAVYDVFLTTNDETRFVCCYCIFSARVPAHRRPEVAEALTRANWGLALGNFELDFQDGEVRFRLSVDVEGGELAPQMLHNMLTTGLYMAERYHDAVMCVAFGDAGPAEAIAAADGVTDG